MCQQKNGGNRSTEVLYSKVRDGEAETVNVPCKRKLITGTTIRIEGTIPADCESFAIDLKTSNADSTVHPIGCTVVFHARFWFDLKLIVRNSYYECHGWAQDEKDTPEFPLVRGQPYVMIIKCDAEDGYTVKVNNMLCFKFENRISLGEVRYIRVDKEVSLITIDG